MKIFLDANVVIDYLVNRMPFADDAEAVVNVCLMEGNEGAWTGLSACNAVYIIGKSVGNHRAEQLVKAVAEFLRILPICPEVIKTNLGADHPDFEDSLQIAAAQEWNADLIVTRDKDGFINSPIKVLSPSEFLRLTHENYIG